MSHVVELIKDFDRTFELYDDGDCVLTLPSFGFITINAEIIAKLANPQKITPSSPIKSGNSPQIFVSGTQPAKVDSSQEKIVRKISPLEDKNGWECVMSSQTHASTRYVYTFRSQARSSHFDDKIGENGRIA